MADVIKKATNKFTKGLIMDFSPENTQNEILTHALNATLLTFNGNELSLQNDMGNARVETAFLPEGYIPVGTCEYGGIIYIVSYNPLEDKSQIGCFPSPERNVSREELGISGSTFINNTDFQKFDEGNFNGDLSNTTKYVILRNDSLNPGDKFLISSNDSIYQEHLENLQVTRNGKTSLVEHPIIAINVVSIEDSGKIVYLNSDLRQYSKKIEEDTYTYTYHILGEKQPNTTKVDIDSYRNVLSSGYNVFRSKTSGKLAILAELITIDSYSVTHSIQPRKDDEGKIVDGYFDVIIHTEVTPEVNRNNYTTVPKLKYYYLDKSQGYLQIEEEGKRPLFIKPEGSSNYVLNNAFVNTNLTEIYVPTIEGSINFDVNLGNVGGFNFPKPGTFHGHVSNINLSTFKRDGGYSKFEENKFHRITNSQIGSNLSYYRDTLNAKFYTYQSSGTGYTPFTDESVNYSILFISIPMDVYVPSDIFVPNTTYNYIAGEPAPSGSIPAGDPISLYSMSDFIPNEEENYAYSDLKLGNVKIPNVVSVNGLDLPFKYDYTIVPCMNYGKLPHLAVSNTVDFSKLHAFNQSNFNIWKYRIDGNQLRLTFGTEVFDTYENDKVDAVILEFYDLWGFAGSLEITNKKSYTGTFTKILDLNALNSLSTKKISGAGYTYNYARNVNIQETEPGNPDGGFKFGGKDIQFIGHDSGWRYTDGSELGNNNDCGVLYSNIVYGVKTYFRRTVKGKHEFIRKGDLFLFTLPIYNDYYYTVDNFNTLTNPTLDMFLTYKITDDGTKIPLNYDEIVEGYCPTDREAVSTYIAGNYDISESTTLNLIKYYKFKGTSSVNLEVGLKKEYSDLNLRYDPIINSYFTCELQLLSDDSKERVYSVKVGDVYATDYSKALNYNNSDSIELPLNSVNHIGFNYTYDNTMTISEEFNNYNFLYSESVSTIPINYEFVIGYKINIVNIRETQVPATTVCALFHENGGEYNYNDFNIRKVTGENGDTYMSDIVYYNEGDSKIEKFGLATQVSDDVNAALPSIFSIKTSLETEAAVIDTPGILNTYQLKNTKSKIGKLAFLTPHIHAISDTYKASIGKLSSVSALGWNATDKNKKCNMVANTELMFEQESEFLSVVTGNLIADEKSSVNAREYTSVNAKQLTVFNRKLLNTMSGVYAYNPDYDFLDTYAGDVNVEHSNLQFTSNLISTNANFNFPENTTLNNYIFMGPMCFNNFIDYLSKYSGSELDSITTKDSEQNPLSQLGFIPNYTFCGKKEEPYLISSITYNIPIADDIASDLSYTSSDSIIVKHSDSSLGSSLVTGDLNKKALFGFMKESNKLVQLDVINYTLDQDGYLSIIDSIPRGKVPFKDTRIPAFAEHTKLISFDDGIGSTVFRLYLGTRGQHMTALKGYTDGSTTTLFFAEPMNSVGILEEVVIGRSVGSSESSFTGVVSDLKVKAGFGMTYLDASKISIERDIGLPVLAKQSFATLSDIFNGNSGSLYTNNGDIISVDFKNYLDYSLGDDVGYGLNINLISQGGNHGGGTLTKPMEYDLSESNKLVIRREDPVITSNVIILLKVQIHYVSGNITVNRKISDLGDSIVYFPETNVEEYSSVSNQFGYSIKNGYSKKTIRGTSITLNDLLYNPTGTHKLYIKRDRYSPTPESGGEYTSSQRKSMIVYRSGSEEYENTKHNVLRLFQGPSFLMDGHIDLYL